MKRLLRTDLNSEIFVICAIPDATCGSSIMTNVIRSVTLLAATSIITIVPRLPSLTIATTTIIILQKIVHGMKSETASVTGSASMVHAHMMEVIASTTTAILHLITTRLTAILNVCGEWSATDTAIMLA
jgi:hypothetical protein